MKLKHVFLAAAAMCLIGQMPTSASAEIKVGVILSLTGPAASLGIPEKNAIDLMPKEINGEPVKFIVLDDATDTTNAVRAARKLIDEEKVDIIFGPSITPTSLALLEVVGPAKTPMFALAGSQTIIEPQEGNRIWAFKQAPPEATQGDLLFGHMKKTGLKSAAYIGFNDAFGNAYIAAMNKSAEKAGIKIVADERYNRTDTSVAAQALKVFSLNPDAVLIVATGTPAIAPIAELRKLGYKGKIYTQQSIASVDVLRVGGATLNGVLLSCAPVLVAEQLPDSNPIKPVAVKFKNLYEGKYGKDSLSLFAATAWDAYETLKVAAPKAMAKAKPGTEEFRSALRTALEDTKDVVGTQAVFNMSAKDHNGTDERSQILIEIKDGKWVYVPTN